MPVIDLDKTAEIIHEMEAVFKHFKCNAEDKRYILHQILTRMNKDLQTLRTQDLIQNMGLSGVMGMLKEKK